MNTIIRDRKKGNCNPHIINGVEIPEPRILFRTRIGDINYTDNGFELKVLIYVFMEWWNETHHGIKCIQFPDGHPPRPEDYPEMDYATDHRIGMEALQRMEENRRNG